MTQFQHTLKALLEGRKTETSRIALPHSDGTGTFDCEDIRWPNGIESVQRLKVGVLGWRTVWQVGKDYAIEPHRGVRSVGRYRVEAIWRQDVRTLTLGQIEAEGFENRYDFLSVWCAMHDKQFKPIAAHGWAHLDYRPAERYQAWRMTIQVLWETVNWDARAVRALQIEKSKLY